MTWISHVKRCYHLVGILAWLYTFFYFSWSFLCNLKCSCLDIITGFLLFCRGDVWSIICPVASRPVEMIILLSKVWDRLIQAKFKPVDRHGAPVVHVSIPLSACYVTLYVSIGLWYTAPCNITASKRLFWCISTQLRNTLRIWEKRQRLFTFPDLCR